MSDFEVLRTREDVLARIRAELDIPPAEAKAGAAYFSREEAVEMLKRIIELKEK